MNPVNFTRLQKYLCAMDVGMAPEKAGTKFLNALLSDTFSKSKKITENSFVTYDYDRLDHLCNLLHNGSKQAFEKYDKIFKEVFSTTLQNGGQLKGRIKSRNSIFNKIDAGGEISLKQTRNIATAVPDLIGYKLITNGSKEEMEKVTEQIEKLIEDGALSSVKIISNGTQPYLDDNLTERLSKKGFKIIPSNNTRFNNSNVYFKDKTGRIIELQITGYETEKVNVKEHPIYKFLKYGTASGDDGYMIEDLQKALHNLTAEQLKEYSKYTRDCYTYARNLELNIPSEKPILPECIKDLLPLV